MALTAYEAQLCPTCKNYMTLVDLPSALREVTWDDHDGRRFEVVQFRCLACASADAVKRAWSDRYGEKKPEPGQAGPGDGLMFAARPAIDEEA